MRLPIALALLAALWLGAAGAQLRAKPQAEPPAKATAAKPAEPDARELEALFRCMAAGLPKEWARAWVTLTEQRNVGGERRFEAKYRYARTADDRDGIPFAPCDADRVAKAVYGFNENLPSFDERQWKQATLEFTSAGGYKLSYDYSR